MSFLAKYPGRCAADCDDPIYPGDIVESVDGQLVHEGCIPTPAFIPEPRPVCPKCWLEQATNGSCGCDS